MTQIKPFEIAIADEQIADLHRRIDATRWPEKETVDDWSQGAPLAALQELVKHWRNEYDWRACEARLNGLGQFTTNIEGLDIHFIHVRSKHEGAMPLLLTHGWPGSVIEFLGSIAALTDPEAHGGTAQDAFHVVIPSLPGYGFSGKPTGTGWGIKKIAEAWTELMSRLGYERWFAQGGDWGSAITHTLGVQAPKGLAGLHLNFPVSANEKDDFVDPGPEEQEAMARGKHYREVDSGYALEQSTKPQTIGYALVDSPVALAGWIYEKMMAWTDNKGRPEDALSRDTILDNIMLYWLPANGASAARLYWESLNSFGRLGKANVPAGVSRFPKEIMMAPRHWVERVLPNLVYFNDCEEGGHFAAWEKPEIFVAELRKCFALMR